MEAGSGARGSGARRPLLRSANAAWSRGRRCILIPAATTRYAAVPGTADARGVYAYMWAGDCAGLRAERSSGGHCGSHRTPRGGVPE
ncbi:hypothetical protein K466DRAFT_583965 [Polyporus arcularius HHB13444]|uniref:Uncharacterized protein n=1 Tax=Polyporus arcularius HHB13444 TaxID=1314778 RepID=A0A5C3PPI7_9APHY|nr:hypothetical protein K466DRAFT_583965 [Polyporus arcularius HHB13444]